jgi:hypothetical protein
MDFGLSVVPKPSTNETARAALCPSAWTWPKASTGRDGDPGGDGD